MSFFDRFKKRPAIEKKSHVSFQTITGGIDPNGFLAFALGGHSFITPQQAAEFYKTSSSVATAVDMIAEEIEQIVPVIEDENGDFIDDHEILTLLRNPNEMEDYRAFIGVLARSWLLSHESYIATEGNINNLPINLWAVKAQQVSVNQNGVDLYPDNYIIPSGPGRNSYARIVEKREARFLTQSQMAQLYPILGYSSSVNNSRGESPLQAAGLDIQQQVNGKVHNAALLDNGGRLSLVAIFKDTMNDVEHTERRNTLQAQLGGKNNAGKIATISSEDLELHEFGTNNKDMDFATLAKMSSESIYQRYKIPLPLISNDASTFNNMAQAKFDLYDRAVLPAYSIIASGLTQLLMPKVGLDPAKVKITFNPKSIPSLKGRMLEELKLRKELNIETHNELRADLPNRDALKEGGDVVYQPGTLVPLGEELELDKSLIDEGNARGNS